jgi:hypothetical protein
MRHETAEINNLTLDTDDRGEANSILTTRGVILKDDNVQASKVSNCTFTFGLAQGISTAVMENE